MRVAVVGAGNGGQATAAYLARSDHRVRLFDRFDETVAPFEATRRVRATGAFEADVELEMVTTDLELAVDGADLILVTVPGFALEWISRALAPLLSHSATVILHPGGAGGALEVRRHWDELGVPDSVLLAETDTLLYACRLRRPGEVDVKAVKKRLLVAALPASRTDSAAERLTSLFMSVVAASSVLETSLGTLNPVIHPAITLTNTGTIERSDMAFDFYGEGVTASTAMLVSTIDSERISICRALGVPAVGLLEWASLVYGVTAPDLLSLYPRMAKAVYRGIGTPPDLGARYVTEDVPLGLVPLTAFGSIAGVPTPSIDALITVFGAMTGTDFRAHGRNEARMGLIDIESLKRRVGVPYGGANAAAEPKSMRRPRR